VTDKDGYLRPNDVAALSINNLQIVSIYERNPVTVSYFSITNADIDAARSVVAAATAGQPAGTAIFFAVDVNVSSSDHTSLNVIDEYFREIRQDFNNAGVTYKIGVYGAGSVLNTIMNDPNVGASYSWWAKAFPGSSFLAANLTQPSNTTSLIGGINVNLDEAYGTDFGQWSMTDVSSSIRATSTGAVKNRATGLYQNTLTITNISSQNISGSLVLDFMGLAPGVTIQDASITIGGIRYTLSFGISSGTAYIIIPKSVLAKLTPGQSIQIGLTYRNPSNALINYIPQLYSSPFDS
jgi:hypothetical protein